MFESAEIGHKLDKEIYRREEPRLRERCSAPNTISCATSASPRSW
jgi:hypothetical protein